MWKLCVQCIQMERQSENIYNLKYGLHHFNCHRWQINEVKGALEQFQYTKWQKIAKILRKTRVQSIQKMLSDLNLILDQVNCSFVSEKVSKIRFVQEKYKQADTFITGGWGSDVNAIGLWKLARDDLTNDDNEGDYMPNAISKVSIDGDVTGLEFINPELIVCSTSANNGRINFFFFIYQGNFLAYSKCG